MLANDDTIRLRPIGRPPGRTAPVPALPGPAAEALRDAERFRLGLPHLDGTGALCEAWLLGRAAHLHWQAIAADRGVPVRALRDEDGHRALPLIVSARISGRTDAVGEDDAVILAQSVAPTPATGWWSRTVLRRAGGPAVLVDLVSRFARRAGPSNRALTSARMPQEMRAICQSMRPAEARILDARWRSLRGAPPPAPAAPHATRPLERDDLNGVGLMSCARTLRGFEAAELCAAAPATLPPMRTREIHWYGNADPGDAVEVACNLCVTPFAEVPHVAGLLRARRRSDGALTAICEVHRAST